jgi:hypothetical protein
MRGGGPDIFRELGRRVDLAILVKLDEDWILTVYREPDSGFLVGGPVRVFRCSMML